MKTKLFFLCAVLHSVTFAQSAFDQRPTVAAAQDFLKTLSAEQKSVAQLPFDDPDRLEWSNLPKGQYERKGLWLNDMTDEQRQKVHALLRTVLSQQGYQKALFIMQYDEGIKERLTKANSPIAPRYGQEKYWLTIFGMPSETGVWAWQFEGHHLSLNFTHGPRGVTCTPMFTGINPALTTAGMTAGLYIMAEENEYGKQLFTALSPSLRRKAIISEHPKDADVMTKTGKESYFSHHTEGVGYAEMTPEQRKLTEKIVRAWVENLAPALATEKMAKLKKHFPKIRFAWMGSENAGELHYYRLVAPTFIVEFTNRDGGIQHFHTLWRDLEEDFMAKK